MTREGLCRKGVVARGCLEVGSALNMVLCRKEFGVTVCLEKGGKDIMLCSQG